MMTTIKRLAEFDLLNRAAQRKLHLRIFDADGSIAAVAREVYRELNELEHEPLPSSESAQRLLQADRDYLIAELTYLKLLMQARAEHDEVRAACMPEKRGNTLAPYQCAESGPKEVV